tara:strand:- start:624 stop:1724 length:1101 start_codon:yes stop_codon:yes gene_type:complete
MSLKKDRFSKKNVNFMRLALNLASQRIGFTGTNPSVGCVIVKNDEIISIGQTSANGRPHAEINAIKSTRKSLKNASIYISLEPCSHYGKTPPCTKAIIKSKIKKVFYAIDDVDRRSSKKAYSILKQKKILVNKNLLQNEAKQLYKSYFFNKKKQYPYVTGKIACSKDYHTSSKDKFISNNHSRKLSHLLRYKNNGILISSKTLNLDNSKLTCRLSGLEKYSPIRFILDKNLIIKNNRFLIKSSSKIKTHIFFNSAKPSKIKFLKKHGIKIHKSKLNNDYQLDLKSILKKIKKLGVNHLLVEGGKILTSTFIKENLFNEFYLFKSSKKLANKGKNNISRILTKLNQKFDNKKKINTYLDKDEVINYY